MFRQGQFLSPKPVLVGKGTTWKHEEDRGSRARMARFVV